MTFISRKVWTGVVRNSMVFHSVSDNMEAQLESASRNTTIEGTDYHVDGTAYEEDK